MSIRTRFLLGYFAVFAIMIAVSGLMYQSVNRLIEAQDWVSHTNEVTQKANALIKLMIDQETGLRGYALTMNEEFLEPYKAAEITIQSELADLRELVSDNPSQVNKLDKIMTSMTGWQQEYAQPAIEVTRKIADNVNSNNLEVQFREIFQAKTGKALMDHIRAEIAGFVNIEDILMNERAAKTNEAVGFTFQIVIVGNIVAIFCGMTILFFTTRSVLMQVGGEPSDIARIADEISQGNLDLELDEDSESGTGIKAAITKMLISLRENRAQNQRTEWLKTGASQLDATLRGVEELSQLGEKALGFLTAYLGAVVGAFFVETGDEGYVCVAGHALNPNNGKLPHFGYGEGLVGQVALEKRIMTFSTPADYLQVVSGLGDALPRSICLVPLIYDQEEVIGVVELGFIGAIEPRALTFLNLVVESIAVAVAMLISRQKIAQALEQSQQLGEELQAQQEELRVSNEELEEQTQQLQVSEKQLQAQEEELRAANEELQEQAQMLEERQNEVSDRNRALQSAQVQLEEKTRNLEISSRYKSEFLANMSHELRTPLNSLLILSRDLMTNREGNLSADQVESAEVIYNSGNDLLNLISEILDLAKIESGKMQLNVGEVDVAEIKARLESNFRHMAESQGLDFEVVVEDGVPVSLQTDPQRLDQILKNLLSNAIKFTREGSVRVRIFRPDSDQALSGSGLVPGSVCAVAVTDTGVGIPADKLAEVFEAFHQVDGTISRRFGGTGLGLSISRELTRVLGGQLQVVSEEGSGSTFTLFLPLEWAEREVDNKIPAAQPPVPAEPKQPAKAKAPVASIADDRNLLQEGERRVLIIEDDVGFAGILGKLCHNRAFKFLHAATGEEGLRLTEEFRPDAIFLDIKLPGIQGLDLLGRLKQNRELRHIPVHVMSVEESAAEAYQLGAIGFLNKPTERKLLDEAFQKIEKFMTGKLRKLLIVEDDRNQQKSIIKLIGNGDVTTVVAATGQAALETLLQGPVDCMILDLTLPDMSGFELLHQLTKHEGLELPPTIIYTGRELTQEEVIKLQHYTQSIIIKGVHSPERLLDEASLFLHRVVAGLPEQKQKMIRALYESDDLFTGRKLLLVDDDMRNVFALSKVLEQKGFEVFKAANGQMALDVLAVEPAIDLVLMDIMMPVMDGFEAMRRIRLQPGFANLPILALTAKAMKEDRDRCIKAGANDYFTKPVDVERLLSLLRVWLHR
jgi:CheY-like chemotaxis protein/signal transduction histidine kinase/CHASE3 domain sensor protein